MQDDCRARKRNLPTNAAEAVELAEELLQSDVYIRVVSTPDVAVVSDGDAITFAACLNKAKAQIAELGSMETITFRRYEAIHEGAKKCHAEEFETRKETSSENSNSFTTM